MDSMHEDSPFPDPERLSISATGHVLSDALPPSALLNMVPCTAIPFFSSCPPNNFKLFLNIHLYACARVCRYECVCMPQPQHSVKSEETWWESGPADHLRSSGLW